MLLVVLTVLLPVLATWVGAFALLGSALAAIVSRATDARQSLWTLVPWWIWAPSSVAIGVIAGTGAYIDGPADLIATPLVLASVGVALTRREAVSSLSGRRTWTCLALAAASSTAIGLTIYL